MSGWMLRRAAALLLLTTASTAAGGEVLSPAAPEDVGLSSERLARIATVLEADIAAGRLPGAVVMVARHGRLAYAESFGRLDPTADGAMPTDAIFRMYSMSKPLVSVAAMILYEDGRLQLADPVSKHLPGFGEMAVSVAETDGFGRRQWRLVPAARQMTVHDLLRHTAGLAYGELSDDPGVLAAYRAAGVFDPDGPPFDARQASPGDQVAGMAAAPLIHHPGTHWVYSLASDLLGRVVEAVSGQRLGDYLADRLFRPLGMEDTGFHVPDASSGRLAQPFAVDPLNGQPLRLVDVTAVPANDSGGAGAVSTAPDYLRFVQMLLDGGRLGETRIFSRTTVSLMMSDHLGDAISVPLSPGELLIGTPGYTFGLGFAVREGPGIASVAGSAGEFTWGGYGGTYFWADPGEGIAGVLMSQAPSDRQYYRRLVRQLVHQSVVD